MSDITVYEAEQIEQTNSAGPPPVVFIHGLWLLPSSRDRWRTVSEDVSCRCKIATTSSTERTEREMIPSASIKAYASSATALCTRPTRRNSGAE